MSGGKGGSQTSKVEIPQWLVDPSKRAIERGEDISRIGYMPYMGPEVAAFSPTQEAAFSNTNAAASAFGMAPSQGTGMPAPSDFGGFSGYSSAPMLEKSIWDWGQSNPEQMAQYNALFGPAPVAAQPSVGSPVVGYHQSNGNNGGSVWDSYESPSVNSGSFSSGNLGIGGAGTGGGFTGPDENWGW